MSARKFFIVTSFVSILALAGLFVPDKSVAVASFFVAGLGFANIFPLAFSLDGGSRCRSTPTSSRA